jgi:hypothetical protein
VIWVLDETVQKLDEVVLDRLKSTGLTYLIHPRTLPDSDRPWVSLVHMSDAALPLGVALGALL